MSNAYGTTGINVKNGQTIDGNGNTLDIKGADGAGLGINTGGLIKNLTVTAPSAVSSSTTTAVTPSGSS